MKYNYEGERIRNNNSVLKEIIILLIGTGIAILLAFMITTFMLQKTTMWDESMEPAISQDTKVIANKAAYLIGKPKRNDVVVFKKNGDEHNYYNIKRIIALPGETIQIINGIVYINGDPLDEKIKADPIVTEGLADEQITLEKGEYFVLGDNRNKSEDSRYSSVGIVSKKEILGKVLVSISPKFAFVQ